MRVLVTGGTGYLGSAIARALQRAGHEAVVFARSAVAPGIAGDVRDTRAVTAAAAGAGAIVHTAALVSAWRRSVSEFDAVNVGGLQSVLAAARAHRIGRIVYTSSFLALPPAGQPQALTANDYQRTKVAARDVARRAAADGLPVVTLYPGVVYGPGPATEGNLVGRLMRDHLQGRLPVLVGPEHTWSFAFVDDVADAHVAAVAHASPAREYAVGGVNAPQRAIYEFVRDRRGRAIPPRVPYAIATASALACELWTRLGGAPPLLTRGIVEIFRRDWPLDSREAQRDLGLRLQPLAEGFDRTLAALP
ncbi:MAG TPA: NAD-dependent epimerase/dehydratase family protein [Vicinamibacterales bacterium]|jgi:farnesol dehydrogenase